MSIYKYVLMSANQVTRIMK